MVSSKNICLRFFALLLLLTASSLVNAQTDTVSAKKYRVDKINKKHSPQQSSSARTSSTSSNSAVAMRLPPGDGSCSIAGPSNVTQGNTYNYYLTCSDGSWADYWEVSCGYSVDWYEDMVSVQWGMSGCTTGYVRARKYDGTLLATFTVYISPATLNGGTITNSAQMVGGGVSPNEILATPASGGSCIGDGFWYQWQSSTDGVNFTNIPNANGQNYQPGPFYVTTYFRRQTNCNGTLLYTNNIATITIITTPFFGGCLTSGNQMILFGNLPQPITATPASGGNCNGTYSYQWQSSTDNQYFTDIPGATGQNLTFATPLTQTTYFQRKATCAAEVRFTTSVGVIMTNSIVYYNAAASGNFTRNNCGAGAGSTVLYVVAGGAYNSTISQADADSKAQNDLTTNGQAYANANGNCLWYNTEKSVTFTKSNCIDGGAGNSVVYTVPASTFSSTISQADADQKAQNDANTNGQAYANNYGYCTWVNDAVAGYYYSQSCSYGYTPQPYYVTVNAGLFSSTVSKADANYQAQVSAQGQANTNGTCVYDQTCQSNCSGEGQKCINNVCESGFKVYTGGYYDYWLGMYVCTYHYEWSDGSWSQNYNEYSYYGNCFMQAE